jgi:hypothetical protein
MGNERRLHVALPIESESFSGKPSFYLMEGPITIDTVFYYCHVKDLLNERNIWFFSLEV